MLECKRRCAKYAMQIFRLAMQSMIIFREKIKLRAVVAKKSVRSKSDLLRSSSLIVSISSRPLQSQHVGKFTDQSDGLQLFLQDKSLPNNVRLTSKLYRMYNNSVNKLWVFWARFIMQKLIFESLLPSKNRSKRKP